MRYSISRKQLFVISAPAPKKINVSHPSRLAVLLFRYVEEKMATPEHYDAIIIGAGQAGGPLSTAFGQAGRKTAIIEREHVGGTCINEGCTPTKTMVASARVAYLARRAADYGVHTGAVSVDMSVVRKRKRDIVDS